MSYFLANNIYCDGLISRLIVVPHQMLKPLFLLQQLFFKSLIFVLLLASFHTAYAEEEAEIDDSADYKQALAFFKAKDYAKSLELFKKMARANQPFAMYQVGYMYEQGHGVAINNKIATEWYIKAANAGDATAQMSLAQAYLKGSELPKNNELAFTWMSKAAEQGEANAQFQLGQMYEQGVGTTADLAKSLFWTRKSAFAGVANAQYAMGVLYENGQGVSKDENQARMWYTRSAQQNNVKAQTNLASLLLRNRKSGNDELVQEAFFWFGKAAQQNDLIALTSLADMLLDPNKDAAQNKEAFKYYEKAALLGDAKGQFSLGYMYENGMGVAQNPTLAKEWMEKAAKNGSLLAQQHLAKAKGQGQ